MVGTVLLMLFSFIMVAFFPEMIDIVGRIALTILIVIVSGVEFYKILK